MCESGEVFTPSCHKAQPNQVLLLRKRREWSSPFFQYPRRTQSQRGCFATSHSEEVSHRPRPGPRDWPYHEANIGGSIISEASSLPPPSLYKIGRASCRERV